MSVDVSHVNWHCSTGFWSCAGACQAKISPCAFEYFIEEMCIDFEFFSLQTQYLVICFEIAKLSNADSNRNADAKCHYTLIIMQKSLNIISKFFVSCQNNRYSYGLFNTKGFNYSLLKALNSVICTNTCDFLINSNWKYPSCLLFELLDAKLILLSVFWINMHD